MEGRTNKACCSRFCHHLRDVHASFTVEEDQIILENGSHLANSDIINAIHPGSHLRDIQVSFTVEENQIILKNGSHLANSGIINAMHPRKRPMYVIERRFYLLNDGQ